MLRPRIPGTLRPMRHREPAICLRTTDYSETSQVVTFLTRGQGVARLLAKGTKRPKSKSGGAIDLLAEGDLVYIDHATGALGTLVEFSETVSRAALRRDARRLNVSLYMIEMVGEMVAEGDPHPEVFDLLDKGLARMGDADAPVAAVLAYFQCRLLRHVGLLGDLRACVSCGSEVAQTDSRNAHFSSRQGGMLCGACEGAEVEKHRITAATLAGLAALAAAQAGVKVALPDNQARGVNRLLAYHASQQLGKKLKMARHAIE